MEAGREGEGRGRREGGTLSSCTVDVLLKLARRENMLIVFFPFSFVGPSTGLPASGVNV